MEPHRVSIVIPVYNKEKCISRTLKDVMLQTFQNIEIIIVDDHSTDMSVRVIQELLKESPFPFQVICSDCNMGESGARNVGLDKLQGEFVFFLDADDRIRSNCIERLYSESAATNTDLVFAGFEVTDRNASYSKSYLPPRNMKGQKNLRRSVLTNYLKGKRWLNASNVLYHKPLLERFNIRFPYGCKFAADREFVVKALFHSEKISYVDEVLCSYIQHSGQITKQLANDLSKYAHAVGVYRRLEAYFEQHSAEPFILELIRDFELPNSLIKMACSYAEMGQYPLFNKLLSQPFFRQSISRSWKTILYKPEVAFKAFLAICLPDMLYQKYHSRHK